MTAIEYGLIAALVAVAGITALNLEPEPTTAQCTLIAEQRMGEKMVYTAICPAGSNLGLEWADDADRSNMLTNPLTGKGGSSTAPE